MEDRQQTNVLDWLHTAPDYEEVVEEVVESLLEFGPMDESVLSAVADQAGEALMTVVMLSLASQGLISCRLDDEGELVWFATNKASAAVAQMPEEFHQPLETL